MNTASIPLESMSPGTIIADHDNCTYAIMLYFEDFEKEEEEEKERGPSS